SSSPRAAMIAAIALPNGVRRSKPSVAETKPLPRSSHHARSSARSRDDRIRRSRRQTTRTSHGSGGSSVSHCPSSGRLSGLYLVAETSRPAAVPTCSQPRERIRFVQCSTCRSGLVEESDSTDSLTTAKALVVIVGTVRYSGTMRNQVAYIAALFGLGLIVWFVLP